MPDTDLHVSNANHKEAFKTWQSAGCSILRSHERHFRSLRRNWLCAVPLITTFRYQLSLQTLRGPSQVHGTNFTVFQLWWLLFLVEWGPKGSCYGCQCGQFNYGYMSKTCFRGVTFPRFPFNRKWDGQQNVWWTLQVRALPWFQTDKSDRSWIFDDSSWKYVYSIAWAISSESSFLFCWFFFPFQHLFLIKIK